MELNKIVDKAKDFVEEHGDEIKEQIAERKDGLAEDLEELKDIAQGEGSLIDKAKAAVDAIKDPGAPGEDAPAE